jgi:endonuclease/exonuclease/phosphatase family metal-dependent hydrolase
MTTYNVHYSQETDARTGRWTGSPKLRRTAADIRRSGAEVVALQEAQTYRVGGHSFSGPRALARLLGWDRGGLSRHVLFHGSRPVAIWCIRGGRPVIRRLYGRAAGCREHGNAILSKRPLSHGRFMDLFRPRDGTLAKPDRYGAWEGRSALRASISVAGRRLWIATVHLARKPEVATCQLRDVLQELGSLRPLVLLGDFNMQPTTSVAHAGCPGVPRRPLDQPLSAGLARGRPGGRSYPAYFPRERVDHLFVSSPLAVAGVRPLDNCYRRRCSSDHRPVGGRVSLPARWPTEATRRAATIARPSRHRLGD